MYLTANSNPVNYTMQQGSSNFAPISSGYFKNQTQTSNPAAEPITIGFGYSAMDRILAQYMPRTYSSTNLALSPANSNYNPVMQQQQFGSEQYVMALGKEIEELHARISGLEANLNNQIIDFRASSQVTRPTPFVKSNDQILPLVQEAFEKVTNQELKDNFSLHILNKVEFKRAHEFFNGKYSEGVMGFCINKNGKDQNKIFIKEGELAQVLLTIGHEIGHIQSNSLDPINEEAKAFAFTIAWMDAIKENNIGNLSDVIIPIRPANNGLHNVALDFVLDVMKLGKSAHTIFQDIITGVTRYKDLYTFNTGNYHDLL